MNEEQHGPPLERSQENAKTTVTIPYDLYYRMKEVMAARRIKKYQMAIVEAVQEWVDKDKKIVPITVNGERYTLKSEKDAELVSALVYALNSSGADGAEVSALAKAVIATVDAYYEQIKPKRVNGN